MVKKITQSGQKDVFKKKPFLSELYRGFYHELLSVKVPSGQRIELGSGGGFIKTINPHVITTDIVSGPGIDMTFSAMKMPFLDKSVSAFYMLNVLHHIKNPERAFIEINRCLKRGGKLIMIEPYNSIWAKFIYQTFHHEDFNPTSSWKIKGTDPLYDANSAIPWIIFKRDRRKFEKRFPSLRIMGITPHTPFAYLVSGGLSKPQLLPSSFYGLVKFVEKIIASLNPYIGMFATIELEKV